MQTLQSAFGIFALLGLAWLVSENRRAVLWKQAAISLALTLVTALVLIKVPQVVAAFAIINRAVDAIAAATRAGTSFVFGYLGGGTLPYELKVPGAEFVLALQALPIILVMSVLTTLLFYWRILPPIIRGFSWLLERTLGVGGGAIGLATAANIFVGMVEAPLFIRPYLDRLTRSELFIVMTGGMAGIAGTVFVVYATLLRPVMPDVAVHLLTASVAGAPAAILISQIMVPEHNGPSTANLVEDPEPLAASTTDAIVKGTTVGLDLLLNVTAMLIVFIALVHLANAVLGLLPELAGPITLQRVLGYVMAQLCWLIGVPWAEAVTAGGLLGVKTILNEFIAYIQMASLPAEALSPRSRLIMLYALCGFANFGSLGIMIGGLTAIAPSRRGDIIALGPRSIMSGTLATCLLGAIVGMVI